MYWGKIIGTLAGIVAGPATLKPVFGLIGFLLGHQFDRGFAQRFKERLDTQAEQDARLGRLPEGFLKALFGSMGHLAKSDGRVSEDEIRAARGVMHRLGLRPGQVRQAIDWFDSGKAADYPLRQVAREVRRLHARRSELRVVFLRLLLEVSLAKSRLHQRERALI